MKKKSMFLGSLLLFAIIFSLTGCHKDDKENEIVEDPLETKTEYYIVGTVVDANGAVSGAKVEINSTNSTTTDGSGVYSLTVAETGTYTVKFSANGLEAYEDQISIAGNAANRTQATLNVKMAKAIDISKGASAEVKENEDVVIETPNQESESEEPEATISIPSGAAETGTTVAAVVYEEAQAAKAEDAPLTEQKETTSISNVAIQTTPTDAKAKSDIEISIHNTADESDESYFDTDFMEAQKDNTVTRAATRFGDVTFKNNSYIITIPQGETISGKYSAKVQYQKKAEGVQTGSYNKINGQNGVVKFENREYSAQNVKLTVETICGWQYTTNPTEALSAAGASTDLAASIQKYIIAGEGKEGTYSVTKELNASISGNHALRFGSKAKTQAKTYTFNIIVKGEKKQVAVKLLCYVGYTEEYANEPISQHSGGGTGTQN